MSLSPFPLPINRQSGCVVQPFVCLPGSLIVFLMKCGMTTRKNDWRYVFSHHGRTITLSQYAAAAVKKAMGENFPVAVIPAPVWDTFENFRNSIVDTPSVKHAEISINGSVVDSRNYHNYTQLTSDSFELQKLIGSFQLQNWSGETLHLGFSKTDEFSTYLGGFYPSETWGTWSSVAKPWVLLPYKLKGTINLKILARGLWS